MVETESIIALPITHIILIAKYMTHQEAGRLGLASQKFQSAIQLYYQSLLNQQKDSAVDTTLSSKQRFAQIYTR